MQRKCTRNFINPLFHLSIVGMSYDITQNGWRILSPRKKKTKSGATPSSSNPSTPKSVNIEDDSGGLERPIGRKAAKE